MRRTLLVCLVVCPVCFWAARSLAASGENQSGRAPAARPPMEAAEREDRPPIEPAEPEIESAEELIARAQSGTWSGRAFRIGREIIRMPREKAARLLGPVYRGIETPLRRWHFVRGVTQSGPCPLYFDVIRLMLQDPDPTLRQRAIHKAEDFAFRQMRGQEAESELAEWMETYSTRPPRDAYLDGMKSCAERIGAAGDEELEDLLWVDLDPNWTAARCCGLHISDAAEQSGLTAALAAVVSDRRRAAHVRRRAIEMLGHFEAPRSLVEPILRDALADKELCGAAIDAWSVPPKEWGAEMMLGFLNRPADPMQVDEAIRAMGGCADPRAVPCLVAYKQLERDYRTPSRALNELTGGEDKPIRGAEWWLAWWEKNRFSFDESAREIDVAALVSSLRAARDGR